MPLPDGTPVIGERWCRLGSCGAWITRVVPPIPPDHLEPHVHCSCWDADWEMGLSEFLKSYRYLENQLGTVWQEAPKSETDTLVVRVEVIEDSGNTMKVRYGNGLESYPMSVDRFLMYYVPVVQPDSPPLPDLWSRLMTEEALV